jgi:hypothetical protein
MVVDIFWGYSKRDGSEYLSSENAEKLRKVTENGVEFEFHGNQSSFGEYLDLIDIVGSHHKS